MTSAARCALDSAPGPVTDRPGVGDVVGRDPAGSTWLVVRYAWDWTGLVGLVYDPVRRVLELEPRPPSELRPGSVRLPIETVTADDCTLYRSSPSRHQVLRKRPTEAAFSPLPCLGGKGSAIGQLRGPQGLALDPRGYLLVADSGNHRVQVVRPDDGSVAVVLGCEDAWGGWKPGQDRGAMTEPVDVAVDDCTGRIYVADRAGGRVHVFDAAFAWCRSFVPRSTAGAPEGHVPQPVAVAVLDDGTLLVADLGLPRLVHLSWDGTPLGDVSLRDADHPRFAGLQLGASFVAEGSVELGPLDSGMYGAPWHDVRIEADVPEGASVEVQTWASDDPAAVPGPWAPAVPVPVLGPSNGEHSRLVQSDWSGWQAWLADRTLPFPQPTDRGRYLWVRLVLRGRVLRPTDTVASNTPSVAGLRLIYPRPTLLRWLPAQWSRRDDEADPVGALFSERYLALFEQVLTSVEAAVEDVPRQLAPTTAPPEWLEWIGTWLALAFDPSWPVSKRRSLVQEAMSLYRKRGTVAGLRRYVEIYTGRTPVIVEGFTVPDGAAHTFTLYADLDDPTRVDLMAPVVDKIVNTERPAHTAWNLHVVLPDARVGLQSTVGLDLVIGHGLTATRPLCGPTDDPTGSVSPILGQGPPLGDATTRMPRAPRLDEAGVAVDDSFRLT